MTAREILSAWSNLSITQAGVETVIAGYDPYGKFRVGHRVDTESLARDLAEIAEREYLADSLVSRPPSEVHPEASAETVATLFDGTSPPSPLYPGTTWTEDDVSRTRNELMTAVDEYAEILISTHDPLDEAEIERTRDLTNLLMLGLIEESQRAELDRLNSVVDWRERVRQHATGLKQEIAEAEPDWLEIFDVSEGWPGAPSDVDDQDRG